MFPLIAAVAAASDESPEHEEKNLSSFPFCCYAPFSLLSCDDERRKTEGGYITVVLWLVVRTCIIFLLLSLSMADVDLIIQKF